MNDPLYKLANFNLASFGESYPVAVLRRAGGPPPRYFLGPFVGPPLVSKDIKLLNFEYVVYCANTCELGWLCRKATTCRKFLNVNGDLAFVFSILLLSCTLIALSFCLLSFTLALSS